MFSDLNNQDLDSRLSIAEQRLLPGGGIDGDVLHFDGNATWKKGVPVEGTDGDILYWNQVDAENGSWDVLAVGEADEILASDGDHPGWVAKPVGLEDGTFLGQIKYWDTTGDGDWVNTDASNTPTKGYFMSGTVGNPAWTFMGDLDDGATQGNILTWNGSSAKWKAETVGAAMGLIGASSGLVTWDGSGTFSTQAYNIDTYGYFYEP